MGHHDTQQVCLNGHQITDSYHRHAEFRARHCGRCGAETIYQCPSCHAEIKGDYIVDEVVIVGGRTPVPTHCDSCGATFPWARGTASVRSSEADTPTVADFVETACLRFHLVARQLRQRHDNRATLDITDEYDVQDLLHALLHIGCDDIRPEEWTPSYAGKSSRMDFLLKDESLVVEVKKTRPGLGAQEIGDQLIIDIERYRQHPRCKLLFCFVYDPDGRVANPRGLEADLTRKEAELVVRVFVVPRGN